MNRPIGFEHVASVYLDDAAPRPRTADGTGEVATRYRVRLRHDGRVRRVYVLNYGNGGGTPHVKIAGARHYLAPSAELWLEHVRDGMTSAQAATAILAAFPTAGARASLDDVP